ncbi:hypothetical protein ABB02_00377 [Clostridiaceae bacterium JG1575]|nr:hypothetical protein ABB02_00377 [Clostridiaceae bacterium JG1575]
MSFVNEPDYYKQLPNYEQILNGMLPATERIYGSMAKVNEFAQSASSALKGIGTISQTIMMMLIIYFFYQGKVSPFVLMASTIILPMYFNAVTTITNSNIQRTDYNVAKDLHKRILEYAEKDGTVTLGAVESIDLHVSELRVADNVFPFEANATLRKGDVGQVFGASGKGKSTFAKNLVRFRNVNGVQINDTELGKYTLSSLRHKIEYISQNIPIIRGTLRDNIMFGKKTSLSDQELMGNPILQTLFVSKTLDTEILEREANLSGGEKQKIALARALLNDPEILVLDEICSNIDAETSEEIYHMLDVGRANRITIVITHDKLPEGFVNVKINEFK